MKFKDFKAFCLSFHGTSEVTTFDDDDNLIAYKVLEDVFAVADRNNFTYLKLKCDPVKAATLRNLYDEVQPSDFKSERRWNTVELDGILDDAIIKEWIKDSYDLVIEDLPRKKQRIIEAMEEE